MRVVTAMIGREWLVVGWIVGMDVAGAVVAGVLVVRVTSDFGDFGDFGISYVAYVPLSRSAFLILC